MAYRPQYKNKNGNIVDLPLDADTVRGKEVYSKEDTDARIAEKLDEKQTTEVNCTHKVEITGFGEEDCNLVIDDQDVVITKIQGQTRRKSLNLFSFIGSETKTAYGNTLTLNNSILTISGTNNGEGVYFGAFNFSEPINANKTYTIQIPNNHGISIVFYDSNGNEVTQTNYVGVYTFTPNADIVKFSIWITSNGYDWGTTTIQLMLNEGSEALPYEPYDNTLVNSKCDFVSTGRNLFDKDTITKGVALSNTGGTYNNASYFTSDYIYLIPNTYIVINFGNGWYNLYDNQKNYVNQATTTTFTITQPMYIRFSVELVYIDRFMLNYGDTALPYDPYVEDTMQCGLELGAFDYHDNINHITHRQTSEIITLNGSENWSIITESNGYGLKVFGINIEKSAFSNTDNSIGVSNNGYAVKNTDNNWVQKNSIGVINTNLYIGSDSITTVEDFKSWLQANPISLVYKLATETTKENILPSGYKVWYKGMQVQKTDTIPYILTKQYAISLASQVLNNVAIDRSQQKQIDELKENKLNKSDLSYWSFNSHKDDGVLNYGSNPVLESRNGHTIVGNISGNIVLTGAGVRPKFLNDDFEEKEIALLEDVNKKANSTDVYTKQESDAKYLPLAGGTITGNINVHSTNGLMQGNYGWGFNDEGLPCVNALDRTILISTQGLDQDYRYYTFPDKNGTVALLEDVTAITGSLSNLETTNKTNLVSAINEVKNTQPHLFRHQISFGESALSYVSFEIILSYPTAINTKDKIKAILTNNYYTSIQRPKIAIGMSLGQGYIYDAIYINNGELFAREITTPSTSISIEGICVSIEDKITQIF